MSTPAKDHILSALISDARANLPAGSIFEIREKVHPRHRLCVDYGKSTITLEEAMRSHGAAWFYSGESYTELPVLFVGKIGEGRAGPLGSYMVVARMRA